MERLFGNDSEAGAGEQYNKRRNGEEVLHRITFRFGKVLYAAIPRAEMAKEGPGALF